MLKLLVPVDGSENSIRLVDYLVKWLGRLAEPVEMHLINIQPALHGEVGMFISKEQMREYHHDEGIKALQAARDRLDEADVDYTFHISVGDPAEVIVQFAREHHCDQIVMGTRGMGHFASLLLGSVASKVIQLADVPVMLIK
jgi:nucleotide-binding universal stress UspA family protein